MSISIIYGLEASSTMGTFMNQGPGAFLDVWFRHKTWAECHLCCDTRISIVGLAADTTGVAQVSTLVSRSRHHLQVNVVLQVDKVGFHCWCSCDSSKETSQQARSCRSQWRRCD